MFLQFQFLSIYKVSEFSRANSYDITQPTNKLTHNIQLFILMLLFSKLTQQNKVVKDTLSCFFLPKKAKRVIFLRAPYKNKLARLNIVQHKNNFIISFKLMSHQVDHKIPTSFIEFNSLLTFFSKFNISTYKLKHTRTRLMCYLLIGNNFVMKSFLY